MSIYVHVCAVVHGRYPRNGGTGNCEPPNVDCGWWERNSHPLKGECFFLMNSLQSLNTSTSLLCPEQLSHYAQNQLMTVCRDEEDLTQGETVASAVFFPRLLFNVVFP